MGGGRGFDTTRWSVVLKARAETPDARQALELLCRTYRSPVLAYVRGRGYAPDAAEDLVQGFFLRFVDQAWHAGAEPARGRFRAYLLTMLKRHLGQSVAESQALKRGGGARIESFEDAGEIPANRESPEHAFERMWAITVLGHAVGRLRKEAEAAGKLDWFENLREFLVERPAEADYERVAALLGMRRNTLAVAVHRLRHRLRELVREELADTTASEADFEAELHGLRAALAPDGEEFA